MPGRKDGKPKGRMSSYAFFVQTCREEHKKKHPGESVVFGEFAKKCSEKWKSMGPKEKKRFEDLAAKDKVRYDKDMDNYDPPEGEAGKKSRKRTKDPNAPKRNLSAFFFFCADERPSVRKIHPQATVGDVAKELGKRWEVVGDKSKFEASAVKDKARYEREMAAYRGGGASPKKAAPSPQKKVRQEEPEEEEDDDDDDDEEEEDDDDEEDDE